MDDSAFVQALFKNIRLIQYNTVYFVLVLLTGFCHLSIMSFKDHATRTSMTP